MSSFLKIALSLSLAAILSCCTTVPNSVSYSNHTARRIAQTIPKYARLAKQHWPTIHIAKPLTVGMQSPTVALIRHRLQLLGDLHVHASHDDLFDWSLDQAVRNFQWRHGLKANGIIGPNTIAALNITPQQRLQQLQANITRWDKFPEHIGSHYIRVNIPSFTFNLIKDGNKVIDMKVVVGRPSRETPILYSKVKTLVFNPIWNVPKKITNKDILPKLLKEPDYLSTHNFNIYLDWSNESEKIDPDSIDWGQAQGKEFPYRLSQAPGLNNALGKVKFIFPNSEDIYMHDTNHKSLFSKIKRAFSSGCIRLERPFELVEYFLQDNPQMTEEKISSILSSNKTTYVKLKNPIPIHITYITAWVDFQGNAHFREDIYQRDYQDPYLSITTRKLY